MFSTSTPGQFQLAPRNPRRRQRAPDDAANPPNAKRQRSIQRDDAFDVVNGKERSEAKPGFKESEDESEVNNEHYFVLHLSSLPARVKEVLNGWFRLQRSYSCHTLLTPPVPFRCVISQETRYCLAITQKSAILWPYPSFSTSLATNSVSVLPFSETSAPSSDTLPFGTVISASAHPEPGLIVVAPSTGEVFFWETISNPTILGRIKRKHNSLQSTIPGLLSGEHVTEIVNVEPAGIIVILSTGRLCQVSIRDSQGKAAIDFQFLNSPSRSQSGGLLGGIRSILSSTAWRRNIAAAKAGKSPRRGYRTLVVATNSGSIEAWDTHWSSGSVFKSHVDVAKPIGQALEKYDMFANEPHISYQLIDFTIRENDNSIEPDGVEDKYSLWVLYSVTRQELNFYFVIEVSIHGAQVTIGRVRQIHYEPVMPQPTISRVPRIYVPEPEHTGFVIFENGIVLLSLVPFEESPSSQLLFGNEIPSPFQDYIRFRDGNGYSIIGCGLETPKFGQNSPSCVVMVQNFGLIRISVRPRPISGSDVDESRITTQSRLEQVVFYDTKHNPIDLTCYEELHTSASVLEDAALRLSDEILQSSSKFVSTTVPSLDEQMQLRSAALRSLGTYLSNQHAQLSYSAKWTLLSQAEKMAAHRAVWKAQEYMCRSSKNGGHYLEFVLKHMGEEFRTQLDANSGEDDIVRHWFIHDTWQMELIIPWILHPMQDVSAKGIRVDRQLIWRIWQASELSLAVLETTFRFRDENAGLYGLESSHPDPDYPLMPTYTELPALWTALKTNYSESERLLDAELNICLQWMKQTDPKSRQSDRETSEIIERIKKNAPKAFKVLWRLYMEQLHWYTSQVSTDERDAVKELQSTYLTHRKPHLYKIAAMGLLEESMTLAEDFQDMDALVELIVELEDEVGKRHPAGAGDPAYDAETEACQLRIDGYFRKFGEAWATPYYTRQILAGNSEMLLSVSSYQPYVTRFLRARPTYAKLNWMNEVLGENDFGRASQSLNDFATNYEPNLWSKQVELAIGKLSRLAMLESSERQDLNQLQADIKRFDDISELSRIQETLYDHIAPAIHGAIDQSAEVQLANEQFAKIIVRSKPALRESLQRGLAKLVAKRPVEADEMIDILTLMDPCVNEGADGDIVGHEFSLALKVLSLSDISRQDPDYCEVLERIIWRRCLIRDDWRSINSTRQKGGEEMESAVQSTALFKTLEDLEGSVKGSGASNRFYAPLDIAQSTPFPHRLASRLLPEQRARLSDDLNEEASLLSGYIEGGGLDDWFSWIVGVVKKRSSTPRKESQGSTH
ncbi:predicted protein [Uncinocarpus reesii 1704]|uniref:Uncharacterized protein n=1 Tax=Uncinocarpus reesii (strain UAMH 1704) TaxID=336963 RepID=C4JT99_UNCRE|nr:uncharacterized protein UREG_05688 [Uncinocarpus reesii 1704]EEP80846.1 predicted protein [Uncinocarpus reesii 1704]